MWVLAASAEFIAAAGVVGVFQWAQIGYRLNLFFGECRGERSVNHIGNGDFMLIYIANAILLGAAVLALRAFWQSYGWRIASAIVGVALTVHSTSSAAKM